MTDRRARVIGAALLVLTLAAAPGAGASPFEGRRGDGAPSRLSAPWPRQWLGEINRVQRGLQETLARNVRRVKQEGSAGAGLTVLLVAFLYGTLHAVGPGHGKAVVAALFLGREARVLKGIAAGFGLSFLQIASSIVIVAILALVLGHGGLDVTQEAAWVEVGSYGLIALIGLYMVVHTVRSRRDHAHLDRPATDAPGSTTGTVVAAGLTPCPSGIVLLLFAFANGVFALGLVASLVMAVGMGLTVSVVGLATIGARRAVLTPIASQSRALRYVTMGLALAGSAGLTVVGCLFFLAALTRVP